VERLTFALLGLGDIHEVYPFPRPAEGGIGI
jgi:aspartyl/asparaginyl-tRNA synthetase